MICETNGVVGSAKTNAPDINEMAVATAAATSAGVLENTRHFDEPPPATRHAL